MKLPLDRRIAVLIPCYNEAQTIGEVVTLFRQHLPDADIYVCDNRSTDDTAAKASAVGAHVMYEPRQGKGYAVRTLFERVDADIYLLVDGDLTYPVDEAQKLIAPVLEQGVDMVVGHRLSDFDSRSFRRFHIFGNKLIVFLINLCFGSRLEDVLSGYRCFSKRCAKSLPLISAGFEIETEMTLQALDKDFLIEEVDISYGSRSDENPSKLNTWGDGFLIIRTIFRLFKDYRPMLFFGLMALLAFIVGLGSGWVVVLEYIHTKFITHVPLAILAVGSVLAGGLLLSVGLVLSTLNQRMKELWILQHRQHSSDIRGSVVMKSSSNSARS